MLRGNEVDEMDGDAVGADVDRKEDAGEALNGDDDEEEDEIDGDAVKGD